MLYLVRHGQTEWNVAGRFQGRSDSPLTALGRAQAEANGRRLARVLADDGLVGAPLAARVSPLGRARLTAERIGGTVPLSITEEPRLMEIDFGSWEGWTRAEVFATLGGEAQLPPDWQFRAPGGETYDEVRARVAAALAEAPEPALIVTHGVISRVVRGVVLGLGFQAMQTLAVPQDGLFRIRGGKVEFIAAAG